MNILIAEDERGLADALAQILRQERYVVDVVYNGTDALAYVTGAHYDAFVCDVMLPSSCSRPALPPWTRSRGSTPAQTTT